jgi:Icc-related predicted phosphoesterase
MKIFFATDIHGSEICWRKFLNAAAFYKADMVILGGDVTGKVMIPIVAHNGYWQVTVRGESHRIENREALADIETQIRNRGSYPAIVSPDELQHLSEEEGEVDRRFNAEMMHSLDRWLDMADGKLRGGQIGCILNGGNDDIFEIDDMIESSPCVTFAEGKVLDLGGFSMVSMGWTNPTPWDTFREAPEEELAGKIEAVAQHIPDMGRAIFNFHAPPHGTGLDDAPALDDALRPIHGGAVMKAVGSVAVREAINNHQPLLSVHGHIHESRGFKKMGRTLAINPGSVYGDGVLQGAVIELDVKKAKVSRYLLVNG